MADLPSHPDADDADMGPDPQPSAGTPRWKAVVGILLAIVVVVLVGVLHLAGVLGPGAH